MSLTQVRRKVSSWDRQEFRRAIAELDIRNWPDEATDRLDFYSGSYKDIDKRHMLIAIIALGLLQLTSRNHRAIAKRVGDDIKQQYGYLKKGYDLTPKQVGVAKHEVSIITDPKNVAQWSDRLWVHGDELAGDVERLVNRHIRHGMDLKDLGKLLESHMNPKQFKPTQSVADRVKQMDYISQRLVRSESARLIDEANMTTYRMLKVAKVDWVTEPGACIKCLGLAGDGPYDLDDAPLIPGGSHPLCRCSKIPHVSVLEKRQQAARSLGLTDDEQAGLLRWVSGDSYKLNYVLYSGQQPTGLIKTTMDELDSALTKIPAYKGRVQRSVDLSGDDLTKFLWQFGGKEYVPKEYLAFSKATEAYNDEAKVQLIIKNSTRGHELGAFNLSEGEVLYERNTKFKILDTYMDDKGKFFVELEDSHVKR